MDKTVLVDKEKLIDEIRSQLTKFINNICKVNLAMLLKDINYDSYTFILSSKMLDLYSPYEATKIVAEFFHKNLSKEAFSLLSRITIVATYDESVDMIQRAISATESVVYIKDCNFFGVNIKEAILFESIK